MSQQRRNRQASKAPKQKTQTVSGRTIILGFVILAVIGIAVYMLARKSTGPLDGFAKCLGTKGAKMYGLFWCPHCAEQKELFGSSAEYLPYVECGNKETHKEEFACLQQNVRNFPTWVFADGSRVEGKQTLTYLSDKTGCQLP